MPILYRHLIFNSMLCSIAVLQGRWRPKSEKKGDIRKCHSREISPANGIFTGVGAMQICPSCIRIVNLGKYWKRFKIPTPAHPLQSQFGHSSHHRFRDTLLHFCIVLQTNTVLHNTKIYQLNSGLSNA